jgi:hypothetical protein
MRTLLWIGSSGTRYVFEVYPSDLKFNRAPGVFILCGETPEGQIEALYVGETRSFRDCLNGNKVHLGFSDVALLPCDDLAKRNGIRNDLRLAPAEAAE